MPPTDPVFRYRVARTATRAPAVMNGAIGRTSRWWPSRAQPTQHEHRGGAEGDEGAWRQVTSNPSSRGRCRSRRPQFDIAEAYAGGEGQAEGEVEAGEERSARWRLGESGHHDPGPG